MLISFIASLTLCIFARPLFSLFTDNAEVLALGQKIMFIELFLEQGRAVNICFVRCLQTAGDIRFPVTIGILSTWIVAVGLGWVLGVGLQLGIVGILVRHGGLMNACGLYSLFCGGAPAAGDRKILSSSLKKPPHRGGSIFKRTRHVRQ